MERTTSKLSVVPANTGYRRDKGPKRNKNITLFFKYRNDTAGAADFSNIYLNYFLNFH